MSSAYARVLANPTSLSAREALAAEWKAAGDPRAKLIDFQLRYRAYRVAGSTASDDARMLLRKAYELTTKHGAEWAGEVAGLVEKFEFHRGCIAEVTLSGASFARVMPRLVALAPIQHVNLTLPLDFASVVAAPEFAQLTSLKAVTLGAGFGDAEAKLLAASPLAKGLRWIRLTDDAIGRAGVEALAASSYLATCAYLDLAGNPVNPSPDVNDHTGALLAVRSDVGDEMERTYGHRPWLALPTGAWPPDRDDIATTP